MQCRHQHSIMYGFDVGIVDGLEVCIVDGCDDGIIIGFDEANACILGIA